MNDEPIFPNPASQSAFQIPKIVLFLIGLLLAIQAYMHFAPDIRQTVIFVDFALFPARFFASGLNGLPGGWGQGIFTLFSYGFLHGSWSHVILNVVWLLAFGSPVARRMGASRFLLLYFMCLVLAGLGQVLATPAQAYLIPIVGASGGVAGMLGAVVRFAFPDGNSFALSRANNRQPLLALREVPKRRPVMILILVWVLMNVAFGLGGSYGYGGYGLSVNIAWVAHLAGFFAGLVLMSLLDRAPLSASGGVGNVDYGDWKNPKS